MRSRASQCIYFQSKMHLKKPFAKYRLCFTAATVLIIPSKDITDNFQFNHDSFKYFIGGQWRFFFVLHSLDGRPASTWWRHEMEAFSALLTLCTWNSLITGESPSFKVSDAELWFFFICPWINSWVNNHKAGELRRHRVRFDVSVMYFRNAEV